MFFSRKPQTPDDPVGAFRSAIERAISESNISRITMAEIFTEKAKSLRIGTVMSAPVPSATSAGLYDAERIQRQIAGPPKPKAAPSPRRPSGPRSYDGHDIQEWLDACTRH